MVNITSKGQSCKGGLHHLLPHGIDWSRFGWHDADAAKWMVSQVARKTVRRDLDPYGHAILYSPVLHRIMGRRYASLARGLVDQGVLKRAPYRPGVRSFGYAMRDDYLSRHPTRPPIVDPGLRERLDRERARLAQEQQRRRLPIHDALEQAQKGLTVLPAADAVIETLKPGARFGQRVLLDRIRQRRFSFHVVASGRIFNTLCGVKRELRQFIQLAGEPLGSIDLSAAQPSLLGFLLRVLNPTPEVKGCKTYKVASPSWLRGRLPGWLPSMAAEELADYVALVSPVVSTIFWLR